MKFKSLYVLPVLILLFFTACEQEQDDQIDYYFCTTTPNDDSQWDFYVDGDLVGKLPYVSSVPNCGNASALASLLHVTLSEKRHTYQAKDAQGTVRAAGNFQYKEKDNGTKKAHGAIGIGGKGGSSGDWSCDLVVMSVFE